MNMKIVEKYLFNVIFIFFVYHCFAVGRVKHVRMKLVTFHDNPPYSIKNEKIDILRFALNDLRKRCSKHADINIVADNNTNITHDDIIRLITNNNTDQIRQLTEINDDTYLMVSASSFTDIPSINKDFTSMMLTESLGSVVIVRNEDALLLLKLFSGIKNCSVIILFGLLVSVLVAALVWLLEHRYNDMFPQTFGRGLWVSFWFCMVTMTTVGYGDKVPKFWATRVVSVCWMVFSLLITAMITAAVIEETSKGVDTNGKSVAVLNQSIEQSVIRKKINSIPSPYSTYEDIFNEVLENRSLVAAFIDQNVAAYALNNNKYRNLKIQKAVAFEYQISVFLLSPSQGSFCPKSKLVDQIKEHDKEGECCEEGMPQFTVREKFRNLMNNKFIPPMILTPHYVRSFENLFDNSDKGLMKYTLITTGVIIVFAIISEVIQYFRKRNRKEILRKKSSVLSVVIDEEASNQTEFIRGQVQKEFIRFIKDVLSEKSKKFSFEKETKEGTNIL